MKKTFRKLILWGAFVPVLGGCGNKLNFTAEERRILTTQQGKIMRLYTVDQKKDSLILRKKSLKLEKKDLSSEYYRYLKAGLLLTVRDSANEGVGIAAPQVGISKRLIVVQRFDKEGEPFECYVNPEIVFYSGERVSGREGCLSIPEKRDSVSRAARIAVRYLDENTLEEKTDTVKGFTAIIFQHEADHLEGILFTDRAGVSPGKRVH